MDSRKFHITTNNKKVDLYETIVIRNGQIVWKVGPLYRIIITNLDFCGWSSTTCKGSRKHGVGGLWCCFRYHRVRFFGDEFQKDMNLAVEKILTINNSPSYPCSFCAKVCFSKVDAPGIYAVSLATLEWAEYDFNNMISYCHSYSFGQIWSQSYSPN